MPRILPHGFRPPFARPVAAPPPPSILAAAPLASDLLTRELQVQTERIAAARVVAQALVDAKRQTGVPMSASKLLALAERVPRFTKALEDRADALMARLDKVEAAGAAAFDGHNALLDNMERAVEAAEGAVRQLTNGGPPLDGSPPPVTGS